VGTGGDKVPSGTKEINSGRAQVVAVRKHLPSLPGLGRFVDREPSHQWLGYFQKIKRYAVWRLAPGCLRQQKARGY